ncbi:MAG: class I SAM-dependent methyltransferase [Thermaurantiacus sp.]
MDDATKASSSSSHGPGGNVYDKYGSRNPVARLLMRGFLGSFDRICGSVPVKSAFEVGCGEGELSARLMRRGVRVHGIDVDSATVAEANRRHRPAGQPETFGTRDMHDLVAGEIRADLLICCEVLEHVPNPDAALARLAEQQVQFVLLSVPHEPLWRMLNIARLAYLPDWGNTPGHVQHWSRTGFLQLVDRFFDVRAVATPVPWTMVLARRRA